MTQVQITPNRLISQATADKVMITQTNPTAITIATDMIIGITGMTTNQTTANMTPRMITTERTITAENQITITNPTTATEVLKIDLTPTTNRTMTNIGNIIAVIIIQGIETEIGVVIRTIEEKKGIVTIIGDSMCFS